MQFSPEQNGLWAGDLPLCDDASGGGRKAEGGGVADKPTAYDRMPLPAGLNLARSLAMNPSSTSSTTAARRSPARAHPSFSEGAFS
jgi:hypothetical protein